MELAYSPSRNVCNKKSISIKAKIRHYHAVVRPEVFYETEYHSVKDIGSLKQIKKEDTENNSKPKSE